MKEKERLAINGGKPASDKFIPYGKQWIENDDVDAVLDVLNGDYLTTGPNIEKFEKMVSDYVGAKYAVAFSNGTAALHGACFAAGLGLNDEIITSPLTFVASANCALYVGATPRFADIDKQTYNLDPGEVAKLINKNTKAIIPVHYTGQPADLDPIMSLAKGNNLIVIEDAAHAIGAKYKGNKIGSIGDMTMFSFHPVKHITTGEGGVITTNNPIYYEKLLQFRTHGITRNPEILMENHGPWYYEMQSLGYNYRITDIQAALGCSQLNKIEKYLEIRKKYAKLYDQAFGEMDQITIPFQTENVESSWHIYILQLNLERLSVDRYEIFNALVKENVGVNVHYIPVYLQPYYKDLGYAKGLCKHAEQLYERIITIPLFPLMSEQDVNNVITAVKKVVTYYSK